MSDLLQKNVLLRNSLYELKHWYRTRTFTICGTRTQNKLVTDFMTPLS